MPVPIHPSNIQITKLKLDKDRKKLLDRKKAGRAGADKVTIHCPGMYAVLYHCSTRAPHVF